MALKEHFDRRAAAEGYWGATWNTYWDRGHCVARTGCRRTLARQAASIASSLHRVWQFFFFEQWSALRRYANERGIAIVGDMPIFVALDSVDVWYAPGLFQLDEQRRETLVAGVPPDYFSTTGQRWGNPLYNWDAMRGSDFAWWISPFPLPAGTGRYRSDRSFPRLRRLLGDSGSRRDGGPRAVGQGAGPRVCSTPSERKLGRLPFLAEDLGVITPDVEELRDHFGFPGMRVLQVGFENIEIGNIHLPEYHVENSVVYTGTHDNNTTLGWYEKLPEHKQRAIADFLGGELLDPAWDMIEVAMGSVAQHGDHSDAGRAATRICRTHEHARTIDGNWCWRLSPDYDRTTWPTTWLS